VENSATFGPVAVETTRFKESITLLEEEVVFDELFLDLGVHSTKRVVGTLKFTLKSLESFLSGILNLVALFLRNARSEREGVQVATNSDAGGADHLGLLFGEGRSIEFGPVHVGNMLVAFLVAMVSLNHGVKESSKLGVALVAASVHSNAGVYVLAARKDALTERHTTLILLVLELGPNLRGKVFAQKRFAVSREFRVALDVFWLLKMSSTLGALFGFLPSLGGFFLLFSWLGFFLLFSRFGFFNLGGLGSRSEFFLSINHGFNAVVHVLHKLNFR
jgi:hypothetical protein